MTRLDMRAHNLPRELTSFVGRERERAEVIRLLQSTQLLTLVGTGGVGKTRLALQVGSAMVADFRDGVWLIELAPLSDPDLVPQAVAQVIGVREQPGIPLVSTLCETLGRSCQLLILDNCEHVIRACAQLADSVLRTCPRLCILATSREPFGMAGEVLWRVPPLTLPQLHAGEERADALHLFVERAQASQPGFELTPSNRDALIQVCRRLDGLPLAIELAAARVRLLSIEEIAARLDDRFKLLTGGSRLAAGRQQTLEATVAWSYDLLSPAERRLFENMSVFADGFSVEGLTALADIESDVLDVLRQLVDRSLVTVEPLRHRGQTRYRLLETLRAFAWQRLVARGDADGVQLRLVEWLLEMTERAEAAFHGPDQGRWLPWAESEHGNVRVVLNWPFERQDTAGVLRLVTGLWWSWIQRGRREESRAAFQQCLALPGAATHRRLWGRLLVAAGMFDVIGGTGEEDAARTRLEEALRVGRETDDAWTYLNARAGLNGIIDLRAQDDLERVRAVAEEMLVESRRASSPWAESRALTSLAMVAHKQGDFDTAQRALEQAITVSRNAGDAWSVAMTLAPLGDLERSRGRHARARELYQECLARLAEIGLADHPLQHPYLLHNLGYVALAEGQFVQGGQLFLDAVAGYQRAGDHRGMAECLIGLGATEAAEGRPERAIQLFAAGEAALAAMGCVLWHANLPDYQHWRDVASAALDRAAFESAWSAGAALSVDDALALAKKSSEGLSVSSEPSKEVRAQHPDGAPAALTRRELEVARLIAAGLTNRQIGQALVITEKTAANHVQRVLEKLDLHSRAQVAARAGELGVQQRDDTSA